MDKVFGVPNRLFDRSFFIGFFPPASLLFLGIIGTLSAFNYVNDDEWKYIAYNGTLSAALSLVIISIISILLMALNRPFLRLLEGYGRFNPFRIFLPRRREEFQKYVYPLFAELHHIIEARRSGRIEPDQEDDFGLKLWRAVNTYPEIIDNVLPTKLGNLIRAHERYSDVVYKMETVVLWPRIFMVIPEDTRNRIREGEALFQLALNGLLVGLLSCMIYLVVAVITIHKGSSIFLLHTLFIPVLSTLLGWFGWWQLPNAARERGEQMKAVFDLYRAPLAEGLGLKLPPTDEAERRMWDLVSRRMTFRISQDTNSLDEFRETDDPQLSDRAAKPQDAPARQSAGS